jgi:hypothetical protein
MKIGDRVIINRVDPHDYFSHYHGQEGTICQILSDLEISKGGWNPYQRWRVLLDDGMSLWCSDLSLKFEEIILPKELFEI